MALRPTCDVFRTAKGVRRWQIRVDEIGRDDKVLGSSGLAEVQRRVDLCPAAFERLVKKIDSGTTPPTERKKTDDVPGQQTPAT
jgi:hypothetical protein